MSSADLTSLEMPRASASSVARSGEDSRVQAFAWLQSSDKAGAAVHALELDRWLWRGLPDRVLPRLQQLLHKGSPAERAGAAWVLARWFASQQHWDRAYEAILAYSKLQRSVPELAHPGPYLLGVEACLAIGDIKNAQTFIDFASTLFGTSPDLALARFSLAILEKQPRETLSEILAQVYQDSGLMPLSLAAGTAPVFDRLTSHTAPEPATSSELVSVIVPVFNAADLLPSAVHSLLAQSWLSMEVLLVNDGSTDNSLEVAQALATQDARVRVIELGRNRGAYAARNAGMAEARGTFITVHDSDDWSHPQKIEMQASTLLEDEALKASVSHWARASNNLEFTRWRIEDGWTHRNVSSLMLRAELREKLGYWDRVRVNADSEYYYRILSAFGPRAIREVCPGIPLAFGRTTPESLTSTSATHLRTQFRGVRNDYMEAAHHWHSMAKRPADLLLEQKPTRRPFRVPSEIALGDQEGPATDFDLLGTSALLNDDWYALAYPDVLQAGIGAGRHYLAAGAAEDRDPGPLFSTSAYRKAHALGPNDNPLLHYLCQGQDNGASALPTCEGRPAEGFGHRGRILLFAHTSGKTLFGAERSFLDMVERVARDGFVPVVVLPSLNNPEYLAQLLEISNAVEVLPQRWRHGLHPADEETVEAIRRLIRKHRPCEMHVNTLMQEAPLLAARAEGLPSVMYVREMPAEDFALCRTLSIGPETLRQTLLDQADRFIMPSQVVSDWLQCPERSTVRPNAVDERLFDLPFTPSRILKVGLVSSNITKKGIGDFAEVARMVATMGPAVRFLLIGPQSPDLQFLKPLPHNLEICDYAATPLDAMAQVDVIASLSHFAESFGRTVVEAMAAGRPVVCYDRGAPPSLVIDGETGIVAPADCVASVADVVLALDVARRQLHRMSRTARQRARAIQEQALS